MIVTLALDGNEQYHSVLYLLDAEAVFEEIGDLHGLVVFLMVDSVAVARHLGEEIGGVYGDYDHLALRHKRSYHILLSGIGEPFAGNIVNGKWDDLVVKGQVEAIGLHCVGGVVVNLNTGQRSVEIGHGALNGQLCRHKAFVSHLIGYAYVHSRSRKNSVYTVVHR